MDPAEFKIQGKQMVDFVADYITTIRQRNVLPSVQPGYLRKLLPQAPPEDGVSLDEMLDQVNRAIMPGMTHWNHPNFFAFYPTAFSFPSMLGQMLSNGFACIGLNWQASPACTELEVLVLDWLVKLMGLPDHFLSTSPNGGGSILTSASEATFMTLLVERNSVMKKIMKDQPEAKQGEIIDRMVVYFTKQSHSSVERACIMNLLKFKYITTIGDESMDVNMLKTTIQQDKANNLIPLMVISAFGSTSVCSFDNLETIGKICQAEKVKFYVDAAYAGSCLICPEYRYMAEGIEYVNSFCFNPHKLLKTQFDCSVLWTDNRRGVVDTLAVNPLYLSHDLEAVTSELRHYQVSLGRSFRSLKLWFVLNMFGVKKLQESIRKHVQLAKLFAKQLDNDPNLRIVNIVDFGLVCFRMKQGNEHTKKLHEKLKLDHTIFLSSTFFEKMDWYVLRFVASSYTTEDDVKKAYMKIHDAADEVRLMLKDL